VEAAPDPVPAVQGLAPAEPGLVAWALARELGWVRPSARSIPRSRPPR